MSLGNCKLISLKFYLSIKQMSNTGIKTTRTSYLKLQKNANPLKILINPN